MHDNSPPTRLPQNMLSIVVATVIAGSGYFLFAARFGDPARRAEAAVESLERYDQSLPQLVERAVNERIDTGPDEARQESGPLLTMKEVEARLAELTEDVRLARADADAARREAISLRGALATLNSDGRPIQHVAATPESSTPLNNQTGRTESPVISTSILSDRQNGVRLEILSARVERNRIVLDLKATKETIGDGYISLRAGYSRSRTRLVTADGYVLNEGKVSIPGESGSISAKASLPYGIPVRFEMTFSGQFAGDMTIPLIEVSASHEPNSRKGFLYTFRDVVAKDE